MRPTSHESHCKAVMENKSAGMKLHKLHGTKVMILLSKDEANLASHPDNSQMISLQKTGMSKILKTV